MLRGSRPGERRGGRERGTPNRRTILRDRILAIGLEHPAASQRVFLRKLANDRKLPADSRIALAPRCFPPAGAADGAQTAAVVAAFRVWNPKALDALIGVVQDATADAKARRRAALKITECLLPKVPKKAKVLPDECGFLISPKLASAYRDIQLELRALKREPTRKIPAIAQRLTRLEARSDAIRRRLQVPCPTRYGNTQAINDAMRLGELAAIRANGTALSERQKLEEAHLRARLDVFNASPEAIARRRCAALADADWRSRRFRSIGGLPAPRPSRKDRDDFKLLRGLYPAGPNPKLSELDDSLHPYRDHPFVDEFLARDGNFYPRNSGLRPAGAANDLFVKARDEPPISPAYLGMLYLEEPKAEIYELEKRRVAEKLSDAEEAELQDLRQRNPRIAEVVREMNLLYDYWFEQELKIATKAALDDGAAIRQAKDICLRFERSGCISKWDLQQLRDDGTWSYDPLASSSAETATERSGELKQAI
jgi:hypothetical protein